MNVVLFFFLLTVLNQSNINPEENPDQKEEKHFTSLRQLTKGGTNAEAYFSQDESMLVFQSTRSPYACDQIFTMRRDGSEQKLISTGTGNTTCAYFYPDGKKILFASTHKERSECYPRPDKSKGYVWGVWNAYDLYTVNPDGSNLTLLNASSGYDAEATISPDGNKIVFTSSRNGDLDLFTMNLDGTNIRQITHDIGYDGGAFFSWDGKKIVYRAYHHKDSSEIAAYKTLLREQLVRPTKMEIFVCDADGKNRKQLTTNGKANFAPFFHPNNKQIIFSSNMKDPNGRQFHLYMMNVDGSDLRQITFEGNFNAFPMFTRDGKHLVFVSDRNAKDRYEFNIFMTEWID